MTKRKRRCMIYRRLTLLFRTTYQELGNDIKILISQKVITPQIITSSFTRKEPLIVECSFHMVSTKKAKRFVASLRKKLKREINLEIDN